MKFLFLLFLIFVLVFFGLALVGLSMARNILNTLLGRARSQQQGYSSSAYQNQSTASTQTTQQADKPSNISKDEGVYVDYEEIK